MPSRVSVCVVVVLALLAVAAADATRVRAFRRTTPDGVLQPLQSVGSAAVSASTDEAGLLGADAGYDVPGERALFGMSSTVKVSAESPIGASAAVISAGVAGSNQEVADHLLKGYFDPHNHNSGIMHWLGVAFATRQGQTVMKAACAPTAPLGLAIKNALAWIDTNDLYTGIEAWDTQPHRENGYDLYAFSLITTGVLKGYRVKTWAQDDKLPMKFFQSVPEKVTPEINVAGTQVSDSSLARAREKFFHTMSTWPAKFAVAQGLFKAVETALEAFRRQLIEVLRRQFLVLAGTLGDAARASTQFNFRRISVNSQTLPVLAGCVLKDFRDAPIDEDGWARLSNLLENTLAASPRIDFDSSYSIRNVIMEQSPGEPIDSPALKNKLELDGTLAQYRYVLQQLIDSRITYVELSATLGGQPVKPLSDSSTAAACDPAKIGDKDTFAQCLQESLYKLWYSSAATRLITVRWLVMGMGKLFAAAGDKTYWRQTFQDGAKCVTAACPEDNVQALKWLLGKPVGTLAPGKDGVVGHGTLSVGTYMKMDHVIGVDFASPELHCFGFHSTGGSSTDDGDLDPTRNPSVKNLREITKVLLEAGETKNKRLQFHVHNGEGYPSFKKATIFPLIYDAAKVMGAIHQDDTDLTGKFENHAVAVRLWSRPYGMDEAGFLKFCDESEQTFRSAPMLDVNLGTDGKPVHYTRGRLNVQKLATAIEAMRTDGAQAVKMDKYLRYRFGHATHADFTGAVLMRNNGIDADINLSSNLATLAVTWNHLTANNLLKARPYLYDIDQDIRELQSLATLGHPSAVVSSQLTALRVAIRQSAANVRATDADWTANYFLAALADHALWNLIAADARVYLGSDGSGTEHSGHRQDFVILRTFIRALHDMAKGGGADSWIDPVLKAKLQTEKAEAIAEFRRTLTGNTGTAAFVNAKTDAFYAKAKDYTLWITSVADPRAPVPRAFVEAETVSSPASEKEIVVQL